MLFKKWHWLLAAGLVVMVLITACAPVAQETSTEALKVSEAEQAVQAEAETEAAEPAKTSQYNEAPMLAEMVAQGELPPVEERLPVHPLVVEPVEEIGDYGGSWLLFGDNERRIANVAQFTDIGLIMWNREQNASTPGLAEGWEILADGKEFIINLREGLKWSDGHSFTADDILFWYEDIVLNDELTPVKPGFLRTANGQLGVVEKIDDTTVKFKFDEPHGMFITFLTKELDTYAPKHYLKQYHTNYTDAATLEATLKDEGLENWVDLFWLKWNTNSGGTQGMNNPELPSIYPWIPTTEPPAERFIFKRNPYFFAVDTEGNQLPYIDQVDIRIVDPEVMNLKIIAGEPNFQASRAQAFKDLPLYMQYAEENEYEVLQWGDLQISEAAIWINQNTPDPVDREIYQDKRFRIALSLAINRAKVNETLYVGLGRPTQATLAPVEARYYKDEYAQAYTEYDPDTANALLDEMGQTERDSDGFRLKPDGNRLAPVIEVPNNRLGMIDNFTLVKDDFAAIGVDLIVKPIDQSLWNKRMNSGQMQFTGWPMGKAATETDLVPISTNTDWAPLWGLWYNTNGEQGEEPPQHIKELQAVWTDILLTTDEQKRDELYDTILKAQAENVWVIGVVGPVPKPIIRKTWFRNVKADGVWSWHHGHFIGCTAPYQFYIEKDHQ